MEKSSYTRSNMGRQTNMNAMKPGGCYEVRLWKPYSMGAFLLLISLWLIAPVFQQISILHGLSFSNIPSSCWLCGFDDEWCHNLCRVLRNTEESVFPLGKIKERTWQSITEYVSCWNQCVLVYKHMKICML